MYVMKNESKDETERLFIFYYFINNQCLCLCSFIELTQNATISSQLNIMQSCLIEKYFTIDLSQN